MKSAASTAFALRQALTEVTHSSLADLSLPKVPTFPWKRGLSCAKDNTGHLHHHLWLHCAGASTYLYTP